MKLIIEEFWNSGSPKARVSFKNMGGWENKNQMESAFKARVGILKARDKGFISHERGYVQHIYIGE